MKATRMLVLALSLLGLAGCQTDLTGPRVEQDGWLGSGGQVSPTIPGPSTSDGWLGSGG